LRAAWGGTFLAINDNGNDATSATTNNEAFVFVRNDDMSVTVMRYNGSALWDLGDNVSNQGKNKITVRAEDRLALKDNSSYKVSQTEYTFDLTWKAPSNEAEI